MNANVTTSPVSLRNEGFRFENAVTVPRIVAWGVILVMFALMGLSVSSVQAGTPSGWYNSFESGVKASRSSGKPLLVLLAHEGCPACAEMEKEVSRGTSRRALQNVICVRVETTENPSLTTRYAAEGTPTTIIFTPSNGYNAPIYSYTGVMESSTIQQVGRSLASVRN